MIARIQLLVVPNKLYAHWGGGGVQFNVDLPIKVRVPVEVTVTSEPIKVRVSMGVTVICKPLKIRVPVKMSYM